MATAVGSPAAPPVPGLAGRLLGVALGDRSPVSAGAIQAFAGIALIHLATERGGTALVYGGTPGIAAGTWLLAVGIGLLSAAALGLGLRRERLRAGLLLGAATQLVFVVAAFPENANHDLLVLASLALVLCFDWERPEEREALVACARWLAVIVLFTTGVQKLLYGTYFHGEFLAMRVAHSDTFAAVFQYLLPADEFERLRAFGHGAATRGLALFGGMRTGTLPPAGTGSYRVDSTLFLLASNAVWIFEMAAPVFLLIRRTRVWAAGAVTGFLAAIELGAREYFFGLVFINLLLLFLPGRVHARARPFFALAYLALLMRKVVIFQGWWVP